MDTEEEDIAKTPKRHKVEAERQLVQTTSEDKGKQKVKVMGPKFEVKEYSFGDTPTNSIS